MSKINPNTSSGSCWANVNVALEDEYIPCGNAATGNSYACCHYGDNCLSSNACYHAKFGITYLAGCTSQDFSGPACQNKGQFYNQSWVGLTRCDPDQNSWAGCPEDEGVVGSAPPTANCKCKKDTVLFEDMPMLENIASLPQKLGGSISWFPGHEPTSSASTQTTLPTLTQSTSGGSATESSLSASTTSPISPTLSTTAEVATATAPPPSGGLSPGEKAGIGIGSVLGAAVIASLIFAAILLYRRRAKKETPNFQPFLPTVEPDPIQPDPPAPSFLALGGFKAELPAEGPPSANSIAPSTIPNSPSPMQSPIQSSAHSITAYQPYHPGVYANSRHSNVSQISSPAQGYPESLMSTPTPQPSDDTRAGGGRGNPRFGQPDTIHELQG
ncbi:hypothetical protein F5B22DRAFT_232184 [Xylaria bambusicola]|uniref:uncharacterized protein n=1 Tax=Xylaria bambusicola TaxID=326684 RepID=UPI0020089A08|nr:uncharacterized protein F5B22DRAFT_232184 [Xylaria bambusicola]KAI0514557.1 hypothetical protein F5B22DRAFT_232184 [Xylaria bambusicola]